MVNQGESFRKLDKIIHAERLGSSLRVYGTALHSIHKALNVPVRKRASQGVEEGFPSMSEGRTNNFPEEILTSHSPGIRS